MWLVHIDEMRDGETYFYHLFEEEEKALNFVRKNILKWCKEWDICTDNYDKAHVPTEQDTGMEMLDRWSGFFNTMDYIPGIFLVEIHPNGKGVPSV